ncbi:MAG: hypothetical protein KDB25_09145 [Leucobacter sp.]|nr:hypothetical protein [Leucobacter sp.]
MSQTDDGQPVVRYAPPLPPAPTMQMAHPAPQAGHPEAPPFTRRYTAITKVLDGVLTVQRPIVLAHVRATLARNPGATPAELVARLERHYLATVTAGGAGVGVAAAIPAVGTAAALAISTAETIGFLEATALFAHSVAEVHGIVLTDRQRTHVLVLTLLLGDEGASLLRQVTGQAAGGADRGAFWAETVTSALPRNLTGPLVDQLRSRFMKKLRREGTASVIGKAMPYGIGAVIGGTGNHLLGRKVLRSSHLAFGPAPLVLPAELTAPRPPRVKPAKDQKPAKPAKPAKLAKPEKAAKAPKPRKTLKPGKTPRPGKTEAAVEPHQPPEGSATSER